MSTTDLGPQAQREIALQQIAKAVPDPAVACESTDCTEDCAKCGSAVFDLWCGACKVLAV